MSPDQQQLVFTHDRHGLADALGVGDVSSWAWDELAGQDWHVRHEDVAFMLGRVGCVDAVPALVGATRWVPDYLDYDESRQLAVKAIHSLGRIPGDEARDALEALLRHEDHALRPRVRRVLDRRTDAGDWAHDRPQRLRGPSGRADRAVLMPLRADKSLNGQALTELEELVREIGDSGAVAETIPTAFAGKLWFVFYAMHDEADHARAEAGAIRRAAAGYQEALRVAIFGPWWGRGR